MENIIDILAAILWNEQELNVIKQNNQKIIDNFSYNFFKIKEKTSWEYFKNKILLALVSLSFSKILKNVQNRLRLWQTCNDFNNKLEIKEKTIKYFSNGLP